MTVRELAAAWLDASDAIKVACARPAGIPNAKHTGLLALRITHQVLVELLEIEPMLPDVETPKLRAILCRLSSKIGHLLAVLAEASEAQDGRRAESSLTAVDAASVNPAAQLRQLGDDDTRLSSVV